MPSSLRQTSATAPAFSSVSANSRAVSAARWQNRRTASECARSAAECGASLGSESDGTRQAASPGMRSRSRLVASRQTFGHERSSASASAAQASIRCSQLSSTSSRRASRIWPTSAATGSSPARNWTPRARAVSPTTSAGSRIGASSTSRAPSAKCGSRRAASSRASRVLPLPPGPVRVSSRAPASRRSRSASSRSRPTKPVSWRGSWLGRAPAASASCWPARISRYSSRVCGSGSAPSSRRSTSRSCSYCASACWPRPSLANSRISSRCATSCSGSSTITRCRVSTAATRSPASA
jgi:hypothetical protein